LVRTDCAKFSITCWTKAAQNEYAAKNLMPWTDKLLGLIKGKQRQNLLPCYMTR